MLRVQRARREAASADIVVVNHHLLLADLALKQEGFGEILPGAQAIVVDEAHQLPDLAAQFFGENLSARPLVELARDALAECKDVPSALATLQGPARELEHAVRALRSAMASCRCEATAARRRRTRGEDAFDALALALQQLHGNACTLRRTSPGFEDAPRARASSSCAFAVARRCRRPVAGDEYADDFAELDAATAAGSKATAAVRR